MDHLQWLQQKSENIISPSTEIYFRCRESHDLIYLSQESNVYDGWLRKNRYLKKNIDTIHQMALIGPLIHCPSMDWLLVGNGIYLQSIKLVRKNSKRLTNSSICFCIDIICITLLSY